MILLVAAFNGALFYYNQAATHLTGTKLFQIIADFETVDRRGPFCRLHLSDGKVITHLYYPGKRLADLPIKKGDTVKLREFQGGLWGRYFVE